MSSERRGSSLLKPLPNTGEAVLRRSVTDEARRVRAVWSNHFHRLDSRALSIHHVHEMRSSSHQDVVLNKQLVSTVAFTMSAVYTLILLKLNFASPVSTFLPVKIKVVYQYSIKGFTDFAIVQSLLIFCVISLTISTCYLQTSPKPFCECLAFWFGPLPSLPVFERLLHINSEDAKNATSPENMAKFGCGT